MNRENAKNIIVDKVKSLPTLPDVINRLLPLFQNENVNIDDLIDVISYDPAISARLLKVANSAYYGFMHKVATVRHSIIVLGLREMKSLALGITVFDTMKGLGSQSLISHDDLWLHSIGSAMAAKMLCRSARGVNAEVAFTASLFHDIGKLVLDGFFKSDYMKVIENTSQGVIMFEAEENVFGFEHGEVGGWLCESWKLPSDLIYPVMYHHHLERVDSTWKVMAAVVHCADFLCKRAGIGFGSDAKTEQTPTDASEAQTIDEDDLDNVLKKEHSDIKDSSDAKTEQIPTDALEVLKIKENNLSSIIEELAGEKDKARSFVSAIK